MLEYSTLKPDTSSDSASVKSNSTLLVSARAEYCHIILMGALGVILFLGGVTPWKITFLLFIFI